MSEEDFDRSALRERRERLRVWQDAKERRGKYRRAFVRSMRASRRHWQIKLANGTARLYRLDGTSFLVQP